MIRHIVLFRLKRPVDEKVRAHFIEELQNFAAAAAPLAAEQAVATASLLLRGESPRTADAHLAVTFTRAEDFPTYLASDLHESLLHDVLEPMCEGWWSVQFEG